MELVLLPGNSAHNKSWIEDVEKNLGPLFDSTSIQSYRHWADGSEIIDLEYELEQLTHCLKKGKEMVIFGKSVGVALALKGIAEHKIFPKACLFTGCPVYWCDEMKMPLRDWLVEYAIPSYFVQKTKDPAIFAEDLGILLKKSGAKNYQLIEIEGENHHYQNLPELKALMKELIIYARSR